MRATDKESVRINITLGCYITNIEFILQPRGQEFHFPDIFAKDEKSDDDSKTLEETKKNYRKFLEKSNERPGVPGWYSF